MHVRCLIDEAANIGQIPNLEKLMATIRSREISACLVLQAQSQLKALYKDNMDTIIATVIPAYSWEERKKLPKSWSACWGKKPLICITPASRRARRNPTARTSKSWAKI